MNRPISSANPTLIAKKNQELQPISSLMQSPEYAEKLKMAGDLHAQGIDPTRWTEAQPADWRTQQDFHKTGQKDDRHFAVNNKLYKTTPKVAANQAQGQDALDVYLGANAKPVEQLVDIAKVPLIHPTGRPHDTHVDRHDAHDLNLHYARAGVDPKSAHHGDALPMDQQLKLQQATCGPDGSKIPLGIPGIYRGYDDGYFYVANDGTQESPDVQALRRKLATEKATAQADADAMVANDHHPDIDEAVAKSYGEKKSEPPSPKPTTDAATRIWQAVEMGDRLPQFIVAIEKTQRGEETSAAENDLMDKVKVSFAKEGVVIDLKEVDLEKLQQAAIAVGQGPHDTSPAEAAVEKLFGMSPGILRTNVIPDMRGPNGKITEDESKWTAPHFLYNAALGFVTPATIARGQAVTEQEIQNLALMAIGGSAGTVKSPKIVASRRVKLYDGPATERPFSADYPNVKGRHDAAGNLTHDIDGNPIEVGDRTVGRRVVGGADEALSPTQFDAIGKEGTGRRTKIVPPGSEGLGRNVGAVSYDQYTRLPQGVILSSKLTSEDLRGVYGHEIGHVIDQLAGEIPVKGLMQELKIVYDIGNNPNRMQGKPDLPANWGQRYRPQEAGYKGDDIPREMMAEAIRIYMANPSYLKEVAPKTAAAIRKAVNTDLLIRNIIPFNMGGVPVPPLSSSNNGRFET